MEHGCYRCAARAEFLMILQPYKVSVCLAHVEWGTPLFSLAHDGATSTNNEKDAT